MYELEQYNGEKTSIKVISNIPIIIIIEQNFFHKYVDIVLKIEIVPVLKIEIVPVLKIEIVSVLKIEIESLDCLNSFVHCTI